MVSEISQPQVEAQAFDPLRTPPPGYTPEAAQGALEQFAEASVIAAEESMPAFMVPIVMQLLATEWK